MYSIENFERIEITEPFLSGESVARLSAWFETCHCLVHQFGFNALTRLKKNPLKSFEKKEHSRWRFNTVKGRLIKIYCAKVVSFQIHCCKLLKITFMASKRLILELLLTCTCHNGNFGNFSLSRAAFSR